MLTECLSSGGVSQYAWFTHPCFPTLSSSHSTLLLRWLSALPFKCCMLVTEVLPIDALFWGALCKSVFFIDIRRDLLVRDRYHLFLYLLPGHHSEKMLLVFKGEAGLYCSSKQKGSIDGTSETSEFFFFFFFVMWPRITQKHGNSMKQTVKM